MLFDFTGVSPENQKLAADVLGPLLGALVGGWLAFRKSRYDYSLKIGELNESYEHKLSELKTSFEYKLDELHKDLKNKQELSVWEIQLARTYRQLNEFYGPLLAIRSASNAVRIKLTKTYNEAKNIQMENEFRLVDLLPDIELEPHCAPLIEEIFNFGTRTEALFLDKAALVEGEWPQSFEKYLGHLAIMRAARKGANLHPGVEGSMADSVYPNELDDEIKASYGLLKQKLDRYDVLTKS